MLDSLDVPADGMPGLKVVFLNGPPGAGKDTAGHAIVEEYFDTEIAKFAEPLKRMTHAMYNLPSDLDPEFFDAVKDEPRSEFYGKTPRQAYIFTSENIIKPHFGDDYYGKLLLRTLWRLYQTGVRLVAVTDSGFSPEAWPTIHLVGKENCMLLRVHAEGRGKTFSGDSRSYIELPGVYTVDIHNNGKDVVDFGYVARREVASWLAG